MARASATPLYREFEACGILGDSFKYAEFCLTSAIPLKQQSCLNMEHERSPQNSVAAFRRNTVVQEALEQLLPERKERILGPITEPYYKKGLAEGEARGEAKGEARGQAKVLARLLQRRFGEVPASFQERIFGADVGAIEAWLERAFDAPDLQAVFEST